VFCDTADERVLQTCSTMSGRDDEINVESAPSGANFVHSGAREKIGFNGQIAQKIHLLKRVHFLAGLFLLPLRPTRKDERRHGQRTRNLYTDTSPGRDAAWH
jgi:hypothetical protein